MAPPRKHETNAILDATRALVLAEGPRAASVAAIAAASGAPAGTLYHRFGNRNGVLIATWLRALGRFQAGAMAAAEAAPSSALDTAVGMGVAAIEFARLMPDDARFLLQLRPADLVDGEPDAAFQETLAELNAPLALRVRELARELYGSDSPRSVDAVTRAIVDLPHAAVRRHVDHIPDWLESDVAQAIRALLSR